MQLKYDVYTPNIINKRLAPIVLLHSLCESRKTWLHIAPELVRRTARTVYAIDLRNHGDSPWSDEYTIDALTSDLDEFLLEHQLPTIILIGHSLGGKVAIQLALQKPEKVEQLIIEDSTPRNFISGGGRYISVLLNIAKEIQKIMPKGVDRKTADDFLYDLALQFLTELRLSEETVRSYDLNLLPLEWNGDTYVIKMNIDVLVDAILNDKLQQNPTGTYEGEVLLLYGGKSHFKVASDPLFLEYFPHMKKIEFENTGHFLHHDYPKQFIQEVVHFISHGTPKPAKY
ncbi:hypothetical protein NPIL_638641 [Nephila pilipes]|uniref:sn-1-specific diacylglycerol lipase ABHD11 n=1 Tax=Nephila pilipes TaxID=299642 RepID=A0A8X6TT96_NEPPI|nr:hypothetical protein NPIL_638641 [Nephila pilipes]